MSTNDNDSRSGNRQPANNPPAEGMPSELTRTILTLVLIVHFFIAFISAMGVMRANSEMVSRLGSKFDTQLEYPRFFLLSRFAYQLTYNRDLDYDGAAEIVLNWENADDGSPERIAAKEKLTLFDADAIKLPIRRQRYLSLIRRMTEVAASQEPNLREIDMPLAVSRLMLVDAGNPEGLHRFRLLRVVTPAPSYIDETQTPTLPPAYQGNITMRGGQFEFSKADRASLVSPPVTRNSNSGPANPTTGLEEGIRIPPRDGQLGDPSLGPRLRLPESSQGGPDGDR
jgi:hypothetical protein